MAQAEKSQKLDENVQIESATAPASEAIEIQALPKTKVTSGIELQPEKAERVSITDPIKNADPLAADHSSSANPEPEQIADVLTILGTPIGLEETRRLPWVAGETSYGSKLETPVHIIRGKHPGPTLCLTSAIHGDELNGVEIIRRLVSDLSPSKLHGTIIAVPIVNLLGFTRGTRYLPDRRDLNRYFPGNPTGSLCLSHCVLIL